MANLAIKGHPTRGSEVIALLAMLGGKEDVDAYKGDEEDWVYIINEKGFIDWECPCNKYAIYSLEEFEEKFPYKVGDKVISKYGKLGSIRSLIWSDKDNQVRYELDADVDSLYFANELQVLDDNDMQANIGKVNINLADYCKPYNEVEIMISDGWKFEQRGNKMFAIRKQYPKTYVECAKTLDCFGAAHIDGYKCELLENLQELITCRDAYWKIAGEQMDLGKPWEQNYCDRCFIIANNKGNIHTYEYHGDNNVILAFPTAEMRDAFYENFKELIENVKELL